ncbi:unnamed protein product [Protopolystoma xenopodis]|uniref:RNase III domain-containing protein n=1 Tax=Protopolystoma xenopodis TaxID=117903 RepID=A0A3S5CPK7_9PLAT|nr:unnamed protein product [Protopolystoma xenopodis]
MQSHLHPLADESVVPSPSHLIEATTFLSAKDAVNLERLEFLGDAFLKYAVTISVYSRLEKDADEGKLTLARIKLISNQYLYKMAQLLQLTNGVYMTTCRFDPSVAYLPPSYIVDPKTMDLDTFSNVSPASYSASSVSFAILRTKLRTRQRDKRDNRGLIKETAR